MALLKALSRLETIVRDRIGQEPGGGSAQGAAKLFGQAFNGDDAPLRWPGINAGERQGRVRLFVGIATAYRNARAHRETDGNANDQLAEFLLVNHLFRLETEATPRVGEAER